MMAMRWSVARFISSLVPSRHAQDEILVVADGLDFGGPRTRARSSTDRASDYGSEGWGFESLRARHA